MSQFTNNKKMLGGNTKRGTCIRQSTFYFHQPVFTSSIKPYMEWINYSRDPALWRSLRGNEAVSILKDYYFPTQQNSAQYRCFALLYSHGAVFLNNNLLLWLVLTENVLIVKSKYFAPFNSLFVGTCALSNYFLSQSS